MNITEFETEVGNDLVMVDVFADWCGPCKTLTPIIEKISEETGVKLLKVNADESRDLAANLGVRGIPTVIFFKDGKPQEKLVGLKDSASYLEIISKFKQESSN
jgi:thioredoxin 1